MKRIPAYLWMLLIATAMMLQSCTDSETAVVSEVPASTTTKEITTKVVDPAPNEYTPPSSSKIDEINAAAQAKAIADATGKKVTTKKKKTTKASPKKERPKKVVEQKKKTSTSKKKAKMKFDDDLLEFGIIKPGKVIDHKFYFTNTGESELVIKKADVTCGCTTPSYPFVPIAPGERGFIGVTYDSTGKLGKQKPTVTLTTNAGTKKVYMEGYVIGEMAKKEPAPGTSSESSANEEGGN